MALMGFDGMGGWIFAGVLSFYVIPILLGIISIYTRRGLHDTQVDYRVTNIHIYSLAASLCFRLYRQVMPYQ